MERNGEQVWKEYRDAERAALVPILDTLGIELEDEQPHLGGERFLMQAVTTASGRKLILLGSTRDGARVVIKATRDPNGKRELEHERRCRGLLKGIRFAYEVFHSPEELYYKETAGFTVSVQRYIEQDMPFTARPLKEQFDLALSAFKAQEGARAATYEHLQKVRRTFGYRDAAGYLSAFDEFRRNITQIRPERTLDDAAAYLAAREEVIEQYTGFLTHTDFVPHNIRIVGSTIYLLDHSSIRFGNKYEGWARFLNFMALYNPDLTAALTEYVRLNRTPEELESLTAMRVYRLGEILWYYARATTQCSGNLRTLNEARLSFWTEMLSAVLGGTTLSPERIREYTELRDSLRSEEELRRQQNLH